MPDGPGLVRLVYASAASAPFTPEQLQQLLALARRRNAAAGITGMLLYLNGSFFQVLEGPSEVVDGLFGTISADPRHDKVRLLLQERAAYREFGDWSMGLARLDAAQLGEVDGLNDFFANGRSLVDLEPGAVTELLIGFRGGRWRQSVEG